MERDGRLIGRSPPRSSSPDLFRGPFEALAPVDVQATLAELCAQVCGQSLLTLAPACTHLAVCGGGALNRHLMSRLQAALPGCRVVSSGVFGLPPLQVEATAFAWLARQAILRQTVNVESITGARGARILGAIYPA